jgi:hypothetical protein
MHRLVVGFAAELRRHSLPAAETAARLLDAAAIRPVADSFGGLVPRHLDVALTAANRHPLTELVIAVAHRVPWVEVIGREMPASFAGRYGYCVIVGPGAPIEADDIAFGAYVQFPNTWYPRHWHAADELYLPLSGTALWSRDGISDAPELPGTLIHHTPFERHATRTIDEPLLALWSWTGDLTFDSYGIEEI